MAIGMLGTGVSGLLASQKALSTASHNIANVNTEGYTRQRVNLETQTPFPFGTSFIGTGVKIDSIERVYDQYLVDQVRTGTSSFNQFSEYHSLASQVDNILADTQAGLMPGMQSFFAAVQGVSNDPTSAPARQVLISEAETLSDRFNYLDQRITDLDSAANSHIRNTVDEINSLTTSIADINRQIGELRNQGNGDPNDVLDKRDILLNKLAEKIGVTTVFQDDGSVNVFVGNGQAVVAGYESRNLSILKNEYDPTKIDIGYDLGTTVINTTSQLTGGALGGLLQYRNEMSDTIKNSLGMLAVGLSETFNEQHSQGQDLNGVLGSDFFADLSVLTPEILAARSNNGLPPADISATITDANSLTGSDYSFTRNGSNYILTREADNTSFTYTSFPGGAEIDGFSLTFNGGNIADGDKFLIRPVRSGATDISMALSDPSKIAAASPIRTSSSLSNTGTATIDNGSIVDVTLLDGDTYTYTLITPTTYEVRDSANNLEASGTYASGAAVTFNGIEIAVSGSAASGDIFTIEPNVNGIGDNSNALKMADLQVNNTLKNNTVSYQSLYSQVVVDVGTKTRQAEINSEAQQGLLNQAISAREQKSGVNLDEEAANLIKYQQLYQAAAQVISIADTTFQSLISILRR